MDKPRSSKWLFAPSREQSIGHYEPHVQHTPEPPDDVWLWAERLSVIGLFTLALLYTASATEEVLAPIVLAWVVGTILLPLIEAAERRGLPRSLAAIGVTVTALLVAFAIIGLLSTPLAYWIGRTTELGQLIKDKLQLLSEPLAFFDDIGKSLSEFSGQAQQSVAIDTSSTSIVRGIFVTVSPILADFMLFFFALIFYLLYQREIKAGVVGFFSSADSRATARGILDDVESNTSRFFGTLAVVNIGLGFAAMLLTWAVGLPHPFLWGVLAATLNFIPYLGPAVMVGTLFVIGLLTFSSLGHALIAPLAYVGITTIEGQFVTPTIIGHRLTLNPFLVFLSIAFWTWMWGAIGAFLGVPLLIAAVVIVRHLRKDNRPHVEHGV